VDKGGDKGDQENLEKELQKHPRAPTDKGHTNEKPRVDPCETCCLCP
jgi:hypothetical protein